MCECDGTLTINCSRCCADADLAWCLEHEAEPPICAACARAEEDSR